MIAVEEQRPPCLHGAADRLTAQHRQRVPECHAGVLGDQVPQCSRDGRAIPFQVEAPFIQACSAIRILSVPPFYTGERMRPKDRFRGLQDYLEPGSDQRLNPTGRIRLGAC